MCKENITDHVWCHLFAVDGCHFVVTLVIASKERIFSFPGPGQCIQIKGKKQNRGEKKQNSEHLKMPITSIHLPFPTPPPTHKKIKKLLKL